MTGVRRSVGVGGSISRGEFPACEDGVDVPLEWGPVSALMSSDRFAIQGRFAPLGEAALVPARHAANEDSNGAFVLSVLAVTVTTGPTRRFLGRQRQDSSANLALNRRFMRKIKGLIMLLKRLHTPAKLRASGRTDTPNAFVSTITMSAGVFSVRNTKTMMNNVFMACSVLRR